MSSFTRLVQNENLKLYSKKSTLVIIGFFVIFTIFGGFLFHTNTPSPNVNWKLQLKQENVNLEQERSLPKDNRPSLAFINDKLAENNYRLSHDLSPITALSATNFSQTMSDLFIFIVLFTIMTSGAVVSNEFNTGTVKLWMIRPVNRSWLLLSKYVSQLLFAGLLVVILFLISLVMGSIFYGVTGSGTPFLYASHAVVHVQTPFHHLLALYGLHLIELLVVMTCSFMLSTVTLSSALAIGLTLFLELTNPIATQLQYKFDWLKFDAFTNLDLTSRFWQTPPNSTTSVLFSFGVLTVYTLVFLTVTWLTFNRRDVS